MSNQNTQNAPQAENGTQPPDQNAPDNNQPQENTQTSQSRTSTRNRTNQRQNSRQDQGSNYANDNNGNTFNGQGQRKLTSQGKRPTSRSSAPGYFENRARASFQITPPPRRGSLPARPQDIKRTKSPSRASIREDIPVEPSPMPSPSSRGKDSNGDGQSVYTMSARGSSLRADAMSIYTDIHTVEASRPCSCKPIPRQDVPSMIYDDFACKNLHHIPAETIEQKPLNTNWFSSDKLTVSHHKLAIKKDLKPPRMQILNGYPITKEKLSQRKESGKKSPIQIVSDSNRVQENETLLPRQIYKGKIYDPGMTSISLFNFEKIHSNVLGRGDGVMVSVLSPMWVIQVGTWHVLLVSERWDMQPTCHQLVEPVLPTGLSKAILCVIMCM